MTSVAGQGEVMLCDGVDGDGTLPPEYFALVVELKGGLTLSLPLLRLVQRLFTGSSRVELSRMHGSVADAVHVERYAIGVRCVGRDAIFLKSESFDERGKPDEPTVTVLGSAARIAREARALRQIAEVVRGESAARMLRRPMGVDATGAECELPASEGLSLIHGPLGSGVNDPQGSEDGTVMGAPDDDLHLLRSAPNQSVLGTALDPVGFVPPRVASPGTSSAALGTSSAALGGFVLETAGACWALPEFHFKMQARVLIAP